MDGGFATHVLIPHPRYLIDYAPLSPSHAGALMCSGLTAYAALKRLADRAARAPLLLVGLGVQNYAVVGPTLWIFDEMRARKVAVAELDIPATAQLNDERGVEFRLPK